MAKNWSQIKGRIAGFSKAQLLGLVQDLYRADGGNRDFLHTRFPEQSQGGDLRPYLAPYAGTLRPILRPIRKGSGRP